VRGVRQILEGERRIAVQREIVAELERSGQPSFDATELLRRLEHLQTGRSPTAIGFGKSWDFRVAERLAGDSKFRRPPSHRDARRRFPLAARERLSQ